MLLKVEGRMTNVKGEAIPRKVRGWKNVEEFA
jgi:hypothetical protein